MSPSALPPARPGAQLKEFLDPAKLQLTTNFMADPVINGMLSLVLSADPDIPRCQLRLPGGRGATCGSCAAAGLPLLGGAMLGGAHLCTAAAACRWQLAIAMRPRLCRSGPATAQARRRRRIVRRRAFAFRRRHGGGAAAGGAAQRLVRHLRHLCAPLLLLPRMHSSAGAAC